MEVNLSSEPNGSMVNYTQALDTTEIRADASAVIIDIDAYRTEACEPSIEPVAERLSSLHDLKNRVFFGSITELAAAMYA